MLARRRIEREHVLFGFFEEGGHLRQPALELGDGLPKALAGLLSRLGLKDGPDQRAQRAVLVAPGMSEVVAEKVHVMPTSA